MAYLAVFVVSLLESLAFVGLAVPGTTIVAAAGAAARAGQLSLLPLALAASLGAILGDVASYFIGARLHGAKRLQPLFARHAEGLARAEALVRRFGVAAVVLGRFFGPTRALVPAIAGLSGMALFPFMAANVVSGVAWALGVLAIGEGALLAWERLPKALTLALLAVALVAWVLWRRRAARTS